MHAVYFSTHPREDRELIVSKEDPKMASSAGETASLNNCTSSSSKCTQTQRSPACKRLPDLPGACGITLEMCAGIADKNVDLRQVAKEEVLEECGYEVKLEDLEEVISYRSSVGAAGDRQTMFFTEVTDASKVAAGGGLAAEGELIEVVEMSIEEARQLLKQKAVQSPGEFLFGLMWFLANKASIYEEH
ncbi:hypothetical protein HAZT_HAZT007852 [Hyalella azteca]|uniref:Uridine diphosphate glucose pyrophosphatase NUDT14 n=1 Tax=Hyalella azteca TaxID=294128 RepID=A0A6A0GUE7_HYAAZ|nr:hypothetical protein HAZT_HAZT007852 [Hyalella azteca]